MSLQGTREQKRKDLDTSNFQLGCTNSYANQKRVPTSQGMRERRFLVGLGEINVVIPDADCTTQELQKSH